MASCLKRNKLPAILTARSNAIAPSWQSLLETLASSSWDRVIMIGAPDRGKSSFCDALLGLLQTHGKKASLLDTALSEKLVGPPACVTLGHREADTYHLDDLYFTGGLEAARRMATIVTGTARLAARAEGRLVIDTSGTFNVPGRAQKNFLIDALRPDHIIAIGQDDELEPFLASQPQSLIQRLPPAEGAEPRNAMTRALSRLRAFQTVLANAKTHSLQNLAIEPWDEDAFDWTQGEYICGLADADGTEHGLGILNHADAVQATFQITTTVEAERIHRIRVGMVLPDELKD